MNTDTKAAVVALLGRPSAGKSTLLNRFCGHKVAITAAAPQTTRNAVRGILTRAEGQIVFIDTPGRHDSQKKLNRRLSEVGEKAVRDADFVLYIIDASRRPGPEEEALAAMVESSCVIAVINKTDLPGADAGAVRAFLAEHLPALPGERVFEASALRGEGVEAVLGALFSLAPHGPPLYPDDLYTDQGLSFRIAEIIREKAIPRLRQELPHAIYVEVADMELRGSRLWVRAFLMVERESQKGMVVGKGGEMIRAIRKAALADMKKIFDWEIDLDLRVKTSRDWRSNDAILRKIIG